MISQLEKRHSDLAGHAVAYFYFDFQDSDKQTLENLLLSLADQFHRCSNSDILELLYEKHPGSTRPGLQELLKAVQHLVCEFEHVFVVIDALDECTNRPELLDALLHLSTLSQLHLLVTSRPEHDIESTLETKAYSVDIRGALQRADICVYIKDCLQTRRKLKDRSTAMKAEIESALLKGACGM